MQSVLVSTVICPDCHAELDARVEVCIRCGKHLRPERGGTSETPSAPRIVDRPWVIALVLLHLGVLGIPLYWKTNYSPARRTLICLAAIAYTLLVVAMLYWFVLLILPRLAEIRVLFSD